MSGMMTFLTSDSMILPNAAPMMTPMARSMTLPLKAKALNSSKSVSAFLVGSSDFSLLRGSMNVPWRWVVVRVCPNTKHGQHGYQSSPMTTLQAGPATSRGSGLGPAADQHPSCLSLGNHLRHPRLCRSTFGAAFATAELPRQAARLSPLPQGIVRIRSDPASTPLR